MRSATPYKMLLAVALAACVAPELGSVPRGQNTGSPEASAQAQEAPQSAPSAPGRRRDPFAPLVRREAGEAPAPSCAAAGKAGLVVSAIRLDGVVRTTNGMIAVAASPQNRIYFLREGDRLCNGSVERITLESVSFRERGRDAFNNPLDRVVVKRLYPSAGEQR